MRMLLHRFIGLLAFVLFFVPNVYSSQNQEVNTKTEPQYLMFQLFTAGLAFSTEVGKQAITKLPEPGFLDV